MNYSGQKELSKPLAATSQIWRIAIGSALITAIYLGLLIFSFILVSVVFDTGDSAAFELELRHLQSPRVVLIALYSFLALIAAVALVTWFWHRSRVSVLIGSLPTAGRDFGRVVQVLALLYIVQGALSWLLGTGAPDPEPNLQFAIWLKLLPLSVAGIFIQTASEELAFRGYLQGHLSARFKSPLVWMFIPAVVFALGHYAPEENGDNAWTIILWTAFFGLAAADLTARTGTIGAALGFHFVNNLNAILLVSLSGPLSGLALYNYPFYAAEVELVTPLLLLDLGMLLVSWLACRVACRV